MRLTENPLRPELIGQQPDPAGEVVWQRAGELAGILEYDCTKYNIYMSAAYFDMQKEYTLATR